MKQAMILAAGLGTRLKPLTDQMPKALVRVGGEPLLKRVILRLHDAGFEHIVVNVHHFANQIIDYLHSQSNFGIDIRVSDESDKLLDTGGGLLKAAPLFDPKFPILIHNVDILSNVDLASFYALDESNVRNTDTASSSSDTKNGISVDARLLVSWRKTKRYLLFDEGMRLVGWVNIETGEMKSPYAKVKSDLAKLDFPMALTDAPMRLADQYNMFAFSGIHCFSPRLFPMMQGYPDKFPIMDFYLQHCDKANIRGVVKSDLRLMDVGKLDTINDAEQFLQTLDEEEK